MNEVYEVAQSFNEYLLKLPKGCHLIANMLRENNIELAMQNIYNFSVGLSWLEEAVVLLNNNDIDYKFDFQNVVFFLEKINEEIEQKNYLQVATIFEDIISKFFSNVELIKQIKH
ncbi:hypothetical protein BFZC1_08255 [Lysinibacillus fusiformis ZC1]|uniref:hypothetical protein n=1 Tax=Lysinibacillus capsici TaxID=2115968 RepID=UPI0001DA57CF|nr:hypothetical protein [Lysinibacillus capsici]EFI69163.1 hypothetical protein BFZC1_08255 [Lysinibacillus fusiformis ZC1]EKU40889.1 hypothetical protein C518_4187 [Lysinibacillus fusiformis ZB2]MED3800256.1 hypothetical protein [Lysinibacillus capsici]